MHDEVCTTNSDDGRQPVIQAVGILEVEFQLFPRHPFAIVVPGVVDGGEAGGARLVEGPPGVLLGDVPDEVPVGVAIENVDG